MNSFDILEYLVEIPLFNIKVRDDLFKRLKASMDCLVDAVDHHSMRMCFSTCKKFPDSQAAGAID